MKTSKPRKIYAEATTCCNLRCPMCVKWTPGSRIPEGTMSLATFGRLSESLRHAEALVLNGIGEPLLNGDLPAMVALARGLMPQDSWIGHHQRELSLRQRLLRGHRPLRPLHVVPRRRALPVGACGSEVRNQRTETRNFCA